jgi:acetyl esterase
MWLLYLSTILSLSLEAKYAVPIEEAYAATIWVAENGKSINVDPSRL